MSKIAVVYWSGTGNTEKMAEQVVAGAVEAGADATLYRASKFSADLMDQYEAVAFGCPSMGAEELEDSEFLPMFERCEEACRKEDCTVWLIRMGRWRMDAQLGRSLY